jgi:AcrR family transcriptional regulator
MSQNMLTRPRSRFSQGAAELLNPALQERPRKRLSREELTPVAREALFRAAAQVVGELGYAEASVARITAAAGVAQGTFYLYFATRQSLFDELLSHTRGELLARVREQLEGAHDFFEAEKRGMAAFLAYLRDKPGFLRILNEAEAVAPKAWRSHYDEVAERYRRSLAQAMTAGQIRSMDAAETKTVVYLMMGARVALWQRCQGLSARQTSAALGHYMRMVQAWLAPPGSAAPAHWRTGPSRSARGTPAPR